MIKNLLSKKDLGKNFFYFILGTLIGAVSFNLFYRPYNVIPTGSTGFAFLLTQFINIDISLMTFIVNFILFLIGFIFYKKQYALKFLLITVIYPIFLKATYLITQNIDLENTSLFLIMIFGGALSGLSSGLIRRSNYTPGGFSVIFDLLYDKFHISIGTASLIVNIILISSSSFVFGFTNAMYAVIAMIVSSYILDKVVIGISYNKVFYIITNKPQELRDLIIEKFSYKVTIIKTKRNKKKEMLMCVLPTIEQLSLKEELKKIDPDVFFLVVDTYSTNVKKM